MASKNDLDDQNLLLVTVGVGYRWVTCKLRHQ
jgi:hypothetical protein